MSEPNLTAEEQQQKESMATAFMLVIGLVLVFLAVMYLLPARNGQPVDDFATKTPEKKRKSSSVSPEVEAMQAEMTARFGRSLEGMTDPKDIKKALSGQLNAIQNDSRFSQGERGEMRQRMEEAAKQAGS